MVPLTVTTTLPDVAPVGTVVAMDVSVQLATAAGVPLNVTVPAVAPKFVPAIVTGVPTAPAFGDKLPMFGAVPGGVEWELPELTPAQPHMKSKRRTVTNITRKEWPDG